MIRKFLLVVAALSPWFVRRQMLRALCRATFGKGSHVGFSFIDTQCLALGDGARIGSMNVFMHVREVRLEAGAIMGNLNWASGLSHLTGLDDNGGYRSGGLVIREGGSITSRHYLDMNADIEFGRMSQIAGVRSTFLTHSIDIMANRQERAPVYVGNYTFVGTNSVLLAGAHIPDKCVVAAGAVVTGRLTESNCLYGGVPARMLKNMPEGGGFFSRTDAVVK